MSSSDTATPDAATSARKKAELRYEFWWNLGIYAFVNAFLIAVWYYNGGGFFWPIFVIGGWGIGVVANYYVAYVQSGKSWVDREIEKILQEGS